MIESFFELTECALEFEKKRLSTSDDISQVRRESDSDKDLEGETVPLRLFDTMSRAVTLP